MYFWNDSVSFIIHYSSYMYNGVALQKWVAIAKQAISELNLSANYEYDPVWSESKKHFAIEFVKKIVSTNLQAVKNLEEMNKKLNKQHEGE
jgi:hypothetical protein